jgi:hypothetical protein
MLAGGDVRNEIVGGTAAILIVARPGLLTAPAALAATDVADTVTRPPAGIALGAVYVAV